MARFQTVLKRARFVYSPYTATEMQGFAQVLADSIRARIQSGRNIYDQAAAPLKPGLLRRLGRMARPCSPKLTQAVQAGLAGASPQCRLLVCGE